MSKAAAYLASLYGRPATIKTKKSLFLNHIKPYVTGGGPPIEQVSKACHAWQRDELSLGTIKGCLVLLAEYMMFTYKYEINKKRLTHRYFTNLIRPTQKLKVWTHGEVQNALVIAHYSYPEMYTLMEVALGTGMRRGEIFGLKWDDVDFIDGYITVSRSLDIASGEIGPTKTKQARRIQMSDRVAKILEKSYNVGDEGLVFKRHFDPNPALAAIAREAEVPVITFHDLRHTFATTCLEKGLSPKWVSDMLGHAKLSTTLDIYWQCFKNKQNLEDLYE